MVERLRGKGMDLEVMRGDGAIRGAGDAVNKGQGRGQGGHGQDGQDGLVVVTQAVAESSAFAHDHHSPSVEVFTVCFRARKRGLPWKMKDTQEQQVE
jgi:hypothetical protein